ncbi:MAG: DUF4834 family protein [Flavobacteriaceae bacterium]|nr:DUF4834 family protein [Flavobacteriaceae bacterium]
MGFLRTLLILIMVYYILKTITRLAFPIFIKRFMNKMENKMREQQSNEQYDASKVGETVIDKKPTDKTSNKNVGEYVDYEEVD